MNHYMLRMTLKNTNEVQSIPFAAKNDPMAVTSAIDCVKNFCNNGFQVILFVVDTMEINAIDSRGESQTCYPFRLFNSASASDLNILEDDDLCEEHRLLVQKIRPLYYEN